MWLLKTEPSTYSYDELEKAGHAVWDGVSNPVALKNMKAMAVADKVVLYHTGAEKAAVGLAEVTRGAYPDPKAKDARLVVVDLKPKGRLARPVTLEAMKGAALFEGSPLVRQGRLSVVPLTERQWEWIMAKSGG